MVATCRAGGAAKGSGAGAGSAGGGGGDGEAARAGSTGSLSIEMRGGSLRGRVAMKAAPAETAATAEIAHHSRRWRVRIEWRLDRPSVKAPAERAVVPLTVGASSACSSPSFRRDERVA